MRARRVLWYAFRPLQLSTNRLSAIADDPADRPDTHSLTLQFVYIVHVFTPQQKPPPPLFPESVKRVGLYLRVATFSTGTMGIFALALTVAR
jgi:hypothetical protein